MPSTAPIISLAMIYYSHVNEDNIVEKQIVRACNPSTLYAIAGSGERVIALLDSPSIETVVAVDNNVCALYLLELKLTALKVLEVQQYLQFIGHHPGKAERLNVFEQIKHELGSEAAGYWERNKQLVEAGILHAGNFERYLAGLRPIVKVFLGKPFQEYLNGTSSKSYHSIRWDLLTWLFAQKFTYRLTNINDDAFLGNNVNASLIAAELREVVNANRQHRSFIFQLIFKGYLDGMKEDLPPSLQTALLDKVKLRLNSGDIKVHYTYAGIKDFIQQQEQIPSNSLFSLSDLLSFEKFSYLEDCLDHIQSASQGRSDVVVRCFLKNRLTTAQQRKMAERY